MYYIVFGCRCAVYIWSHSLYFAQFTQWGREKIMDIWQATFSNNFLVWILHFDSNFDEIYFYVPNWQQSSIDSDNDLATIRHYLSQSWANKSRTIQYSAIWIPTMSTFDRYFAYRNIEGFLRVTVFFPVWHKHHRIVLFIQNTNRLMLW